MKHLVLKQDKEFEDRLGIETHLINILDVPLSKLRTEIQKTKGLVVVQGGDLKVNRAVLENKNVDILLSPEKNDNSDLLFFRRSGLNQVLCKLAAKNDVAIGFNFSDVLNSNGKKRALILGRMRQNVKFCRKYKVKMIFSSFAKNKYELRNNDLMKVFERILS